MPNRYMVEKFSNFMLYIPGDYTETWEKFIHYSKIEGKALVKQNKRTGPLSYTGTVLRELIKVWVESMDEERLQTKLELETATEQGKTSAEDATEDAEETTEEQTEVRQEGTESSDEINYRQKESSEPETQEEETQDE